MIQFNRGRKTSLPTLNIAEPAFTLDTKQIFIGDGTENIELMKKSELNNFEFSGEAETNEKINVIGMINELFQSGVEIQEIAKSALDTNNIGYSNDNLKELTQIMANNLVPNKLIKEHINDNKISLTINKNGLIIISEPFLICQIIENELNILANDDVHPWITSYNDNIFEANNVAITEIDAYYYTK